MCFVSSRLYNVAKAAIRIMIFEDQCAVIFEESVCSPYSVSLSSPYLESNRGSCNVCEKHSSIEFSTESLVLVSKGIDDFQINVALQVQQFATISACVQRHCFHAFKYTIA